jgi:hypothetical protein
LPVLSAALPLRYLLRPCLSPLLPCLSLICCLACLSSAPLFHWWPFCRPSAPRVGPHGSLVPAWLPRWLLRRCDEA